MAANSTIGGKGYIGRIGQGGTQVVNAPNQTKGKRGKTIAHKGGDLRTKGGK